MNTNKGYGAIVVGGGLFGVTIALHLAEHMPTVLVERGNDILTGASYVNQNRVHAGYHYPRSLSTALESIDGFESFSAAFGDCLRFYTSYYGVVCDGSYTSASEYASFLTDLERERGIRHCPVHRDVWFLQPGSVCSLYEVQEPVVDVPALRAKVWRQICDQRGLTVLLHTKALELLQGSPHRLRTSAGVLTAPILVNATYGDLNWAGWNRLLRLELVEMVQVQGPRGLPGITLVDGDFFSILPFGFAQDVYWFYSVELSVRWKAESCGLPPKAGCLESNWPAMVTAASDYFTFMGNLTKIESRYAIRATLPGPDVDWTKARPTVVEEPSPGLYHVLAGKLVTCVDAARRITSHLGLAVRS